MKSVSKCSCYLCQKKSVSKCSPDLDFFFSSSSLSISGEQEGIAKEIEEKVNPFSGLADVF